MCDVWRSLGWGVRYFQGVKKDITEDVYEQGFEGQIGAYQAEKSGKCILGRGNSIRKGKEAQSLGNQE